MNRAQAITATFFDGIGMISLLKKLKSAFYLTLTSCVLIVLGVGSAMAAGPSAPTGLWTSMNEPNVQIFWDTSGTDSHLLQYNLYRSSSEIGPYDQISPSVMNGTMDSPPYGSPVWYKISATRDGIEGELSASVASGVVTGLGVTDDASTPGSKGMLSWSAASSAMSQPTYTIYISNSPNGDFSYHATTNDTWFHDTVYSNCVSCWYKVSANVPNGLGLAPSIAASKTSADIGVPTGLTDTTDRGNSSSGQMSMTWIAVANASTYNAYRSRSADGPYMIVRSDLPFNEYSDYGEGFGSYWYKVSAIAVFPEAKRTVEWWKIVLRSATRRCFHEALAQ